MKQAVIGAVVILGAVAWTDLAGAQIRMVPKNTIVNEYVWEPVQQTYTYWQVTWVPVIRTYSCTQARRNPNGTYSYYTTTCTRTDYTYQYVPVTRTYTYYNLRVRSRTQFEMAVVPDTKAMTDRLEFERDIGRTKESMEADLARLSSETRELFSKNRLTEEFQISNESLGEERFLEQFSTGSLARAVHVGR